MPRWETGGKCTERTGVGDRWRFEIVVRRLPTYAGGGGRPRSSGTTGSAARNIAVIEAGAPVLCIVGVPSDTTSQENAGPSTPISSSKAAASCTRIHGELWSAVLPARRQLGTAPARSAVNRRRRGVKGGGEACPAIYCACSSVSPFDRYAV